MTELTNLTLNDAVVAEAGYAGETYRTADGDEVPIDALTAVRFLAERYDELRAGTLGQPREGA